MAYDPNDPADKKILDDAVKAAVATAVKDSVSKADAKTAQAQAVKDALAEQASDHEDDIAGLKTKNTDLVAKIKKLRDGKGDDGSEAEVERLENELSEAKAELKTAQKDLKKTTETLATAETNLASEKTNATNSFVETSLTDALVAANVAAPFMDAAKALLKQQITVDGEGSDRKAIAEGKALGDFIKDWSQGDQGKHMIAAKGNGGGNANPGNPLGGSKKLSEMTATEEAAYANANPDAYAKEIGDIQV